jgi:pyrrolysyl-tRNA synthetase-like protein
MKLLAPAYRQASTGRGLQGTLRSMSVKLTEIQRQRLRELNAAGLLLEAVFRNARERDQSFQEVEKKLVEEGRQRLVRLRDTNRRPALCQMEEALVEALISSGFVQVVTPILLSKGLLEKMSITPEHSLSKQVFWVSQNKCLRPMLAPHLYFLLRNLVRSWEKPVRIFEVGPCFRKESRGSQHLGEFTMLNLVELGCPEDGRPERLKELARLVMKASGIEDYQLVSKSSEVYGETIDVVSGIELGSCAMGPHSLDGAWGIVDPWVGLGFGLERLVMAKEGHQNIQRVGRSLVYLDGVRLNI